MIHPLQEMMSRRRAGEKCGIPSYCSSNEFVIEAVLERAKNTGRPALIEATANQVNQSGGYTGMQPKDFVEFVLSAAMKLEVDRRLVILGGDHLGPLTWSSDPEPLAMEKAEELVRLYVLAGFTKIHLDTSMKLGDDPDDRVLETEVIARRGVRLYRASIEAYEQLIERQPEALRPVFVIGSEVPIPGGTREKEEGILVTKPEDFEDTVSTYDRIFKEEGFLKAWNDIIAVVVQPGVEFGDSQIFMYDRKKAGKLCGELKKHPEIVFEGHSTDYQSKERLKEMVEDGIAILKVGPALTFGLRESLFAMSMIEKELVPEEKQAYFKEVLDRVMQENPKNWINHYHGNEKVVAFARKYSFSDRCRYYMGEREVTEAIGKLLDNLSKMEISMNLLHQYMPRQYERIQAGDLTAEPHELVKDSIVEFMLDYEYAAYENTEHRR